MNSTFSRFCIHRAESPIVAASGCPSTSFSPAPSAAVSRFRASKILRLGLMYRKVLASSHQHLMAEAPVARRVPQEKQTNSRPAPGPSPSSSIINHGERNHQGLGNAFVFLDTTVSAFFCKGIRTHYQQQTAQAPAQDANAARLAPAPSSTTYRPSRTVLGESRTCYYPAKPGRIVRGRGWGRATF